MKLLLTVVFAAIPILGMVVVGWLILRKSKADHWQSYACLTILVIFASLVFGTLAGQVTSFGYGDARVQGVEQKVEEAKKLLEELRNLASTTAELSALATQPRPIGRLQASVDYDGEIQYYTTAKQRISALLKQAGRSESEIQKIVEQHTKEIQLLEAERAQERRSDK
jgi:F0F1-type ATP synthase membrane subunit b/b'